MSDIRITHNAALNRYELHVGDALASIADYRPSGDRLVFSHTETHHEFRGQGLAAKLVAWALDDVRARGLSVFPTCWFVADFIDDHPEYRDLLAEDRRAS